ncbi:unnamed protein product [Porites lobata]|uniref:Uncharacterized protein n=1 Tax=Porites lobata TaxID=104759 RepID=A0ABN8RAP9_9CNID|nr:unnamed protein product [Porites lobata]
MHEKGGCCWNLSEKAKITDSFGLNGNDKVCKEVCYRIITISHFLKYVIIRTNLVRNIFKTSLLSLSEYAKLKNT